MRRHNHSLYVRYLADVPGITFQPEKEGTKNVYWMNGAAIEPEKFGISRDELIDQLRKRGIESRKFFTGMHRQPSLQKYGCDCGGQYPISDSLAENGLYLPSGSNLHEEQIGYICNMIKSCV